MQTRSKFIRQIASAFSVHPVVALLGPRQCGKTTLSKLCAENELSRGKAVHIFDLENPRDLNRLSDPLLALENLSGLIILDEIQRTPEIFQILRVLVDRPENKAQFLVLGSASRELIKQSSESLAGRIEYLELTPFQGTELGAEELNLLWLRGGFPRSFLAETEEQSFRWREQYISTYLEQDIPNLGLQIPAPALRRFWAVLSHYHAQICNYSELSRALDIADTTARRYLDVLVGSFMLRSLQPWSENIKKRQVKSPKLFFRDSGILHAFLDCPSRETLERHPKLGASWEGFCLEELIRLHEARPHQAFFWAAHGEGEIDLLIQSEGKRFAYEVKYSSTPKITKGLKVAIEALKLEQVVIVNPGQDEYQLEEKVWVKGLQRLVQVSSAGKLV